ncbi:hypothetical protein CDQ84_03130 [Clostridium thermosuccinogenes]|uniref:DUF4038 domain-containing protein n=1 Tax=Clostridium thermosuccinogenes TaxID=84032 RepID=A0A2K2FQS2_9CLOT|nr:DUF4038 domain-containing protein [Pseudoclostridium thermosuccinogenes]AUS96054.1 hypothetical protein CDO33_06155 [Pseudoclostridium thermosuccinogenes]PNT99442.1 hypothetical protein CDQ85_03130 [Pseudoclostridium thermosuccinogenes]PNU01129.1 hypothetical protein CDQ84_03130 [Pseudoclostridium thermosuccinogenes]
MNCIKIQSKTENVIPAFPLKISENRRYLVDQNNKPFFYHGDTCWKLFWEFTEEEAELYLEDRKQKGFTVIQVQLLPHRNYQANREGNTPFMVRGDLTTPNPAYFAHVDKVIKIAMEKGLGLLIAPVWASKWEQDWYKHLNTDNAEIFSRYLANRYKDFKSIIGWIHGGDDDALELHNCIRIFGRIFKEVAPWQINTFHANQKGGWEFFNNDTWYDMNMAYSYNYSNMVEQMTKAYHLNPVRPVILGETHYEYNTGISSSLLRKFAYTSVILGGAGQTYGNKDIWIATCFWRVAMDAPAAHHMSHLKELFTSVKWYQMIPDTTHVLVTKGYGSGEEFAPACYSEDGSLAIVYIPTACTLTIDTDKFSGETEAYWFDPTSGMYIDIGNVTIQGEKKFKTPGKNSDGDEDWVLLFKGNCSI